MTKRRQNYKGKQRRRYATINPSTYLPQNMFEEILCKLPCKDMIWSKLVCKTWNSIISSPKFIDYYNKNLHKIEGDLIFLEPRYTYIDNGFEFYAISPINGTIVDTDPLEYYARKRSNTELVTFLGSCNGLVAILCDRKLILWNPLTNEQSFIRVRVNVVLNFREDFYPPYLFGLCYDNCTEEYVVVIGFEYPPDFDDGIGYGGNGWMDVYFYNFKYGSERRDYVWTEFRLSDGIILGSDIGKVICGLPHWVIQYREFIDPTLVKKDIVYFDLHEEKFKKMAQPDSSGDKTLLGLATLDGESQLGCVLHDIAYANLEVLVMNQYGNSESWSNVFTIPYMNMLVDNRLNRRSINLEVWMMNVMGFMPSGELLISLNNEELWVYDIDKGTPMETKFQNIIFDFVLVCKPTLISPPEPGVEIGDQRKEGEGEATLISPPKPVVEISDETEDEYDYRYGYRYTYGYYSDYNDDYTYYYGLYVNEVEYDVYVNEHYAKWSRLRSRLGRKHCIVCM